MERSSNTARNAGFTLCSAMVAALLAGCSGQPSIASTGAAPSAQASAAGQGEGVAERAIARAEARVAKSPDNASARADLAQLYLAAGRFTSSTTTFEDAVSLGDNSPRTGLSLALAYVGSGRSEEALGVLARWRDQIPAGDFGLAVALAGQPAQGVAILSDALRGGENNPKVRQNLAYAYALDGRWGEARIIASQDVPADQLDARLGEWASHGRPDQSRARVAGLLGTPMPADAGQPAALALNGSAHAPLMAMAEAPVAPAPVEELPAVATGESFWGTSEAQPAAPMPMLAAAPAPAAPVKVSAPKPARTSIERAFQPPARAEQPRGAGHVVQLGSFRTMEGAKRAWGIYQRRDPGLRDHTMRITEAQVQGQRYFRVAAVGFDRGAAQTLCSTVKQRGGACLAYAEGRQLPGLVAGGGSGPLKARR